jgi:hypothetical protein
VARFGAVVFIGICVGTHSWCHGCIGPGHDSRVSQGTVRPIRATVPFPLSAVLRKGVAGLCIALMELWGLVWVPTPSEGSVPYGDALRPAPDKLATLQLEMTAQRGAFLNRVRFSTAWGCCNAWTHLTVILCTGQEHPCVVNAAHGIIQPYQEPKGPPGNNRRE